MARVNVIENDNGVPDADVFDPYSVGLCYASVCTSLPLEEATKWLNVLRPTGVSSDWVPSEDATFSDGKTANPCPCDQHPETHRHYLFNC